VLCVDDGGLARENSLVKQAEADDTYAFSTPLRKAPEHPFCKDRPSGPGEGGGDLEALPSHMKGEIIEGVLYTMTRPRGPHQRTGTIVGGDLVDPFDRGRGGPGGWWILVEPGIELKKPYYARVGVAYHWLLDLAATALTAYRLESGRWVEIGVFGDERDARIEPFDAVPLDVAGFWP
jgi:hypothetical protein